MTDVPPVSKDGFVFSGEFYAETTGHKLHRRATASELRTLFKSHVGKDYPSHWYEAQLMHYGLRHSRVKGTAKMRLFEFVVKRVGKFFVPSEILEIESQLKSEWQRNLRQAKRQTQNRQAQMCEMHTQHSTRTHSANWQNKDKPTCNSGFGGPDAEPTITNTPGYNVTVMIRPEDVRHGGLSHKGQDREAGSVPGQSGQTIEAPRENMASVRRERDAGHSKPPSQNSASAEVQRRQQQKNQLNLKSESVQRGTQYHDNQNQGQSKPIRIQNQGFWQKARQKRQQEKYRKRHQQKQQQNMASSTPNIQPPAAHAAYSKNLRPTWQTPPEQPSAQMNEWSSPSQPYLTSKPPGCSFAQQINCQGSPAQGRNTHSGSKSSRLRHVTFQ